MEKRIDEQFIDHGFGFPVILLNVPMVKIRKVWTPAINYSKLSDAVLKALAFKPVRLTGAEIRFIRLTLKLTLKDFGQRFETTHAGVIKWEKFENQPTNMNWATEKDIRLFTLESIKKSQKISTLYKLLKQKLTAELWETRIDINEEKNLAA